MDAAYACHPIISIPEEIEQVEKLLRLQFEIKNSFLDLNSIGRIQELLDATKEVPNKVQV